MLAAFLTKYDSLLIGYLEGLFEGQLWGATKTVTADLKRGNIYEEHLGASDHISFNLYRFAGDNIGLEPCEMPESKVIAFVLGFVGTN